MFKIIRKWYFKLYHLLKFLGIFVLIFGIEKNVYADTVSIQSLEVEECSSVNKFKLRNSTQTKNNSFGDNTGWIFGQKFSYDTSSNILSLNNDYYSFAYNKLLLVEGGKTYLSQFPGQKRQYIYIFDTDFNYIDYVTNNWTASLEINVPSEKNYYYILASYADTRAVYYMDNATLHDSTITNDVYAFVPMECPDLSDETQENEVYSSFITLYVNKLNYLANGFTNNPYLIAMIGIIFAWIVLELFLKILHLRGGYKK